MTRTDYLKTAEALLAEKFSDAKCAFVAGSVTRGEQTATSDIDIVIVYDPDILPKAYRASLFYQDWPIELFVQNANSLSYFWQKDIEGGEPVLINMVAEGIALPKNDAYALSLRQKACEIMAAGPIALSANAIEWRRYMITDMLDDLEDYKNTAELYGILSELYQMLGDFYLRANQKWSGQSKAMIRALKKYFPELIDEYESAFKKGFSGDTEPVSDLANKLLSPFGGKLWNDWLSYAPEEANRPAEK